MNIRTRLVLTLALAVAGTAGAPVQGAGQSTGAVPTVPGTAVVHMSAFRADTLPILCHDANDAAVGFETETASAEWTPKLDLKLWPTPGASDSLSITLVDGGTTYNVTFTKGTHEAGRPLLAGVNLVSWDQGRGLDASFVADCSQRLTRGG